MKLQTPNPCLFSDFRIWLQALLAENLETNAWFSQRWLAKKTKWPPSLFSEVVAGRRSVTLKRALDLAQFLKFSSVRTERLLLLALATHEDESVRNHFSLESKRRRARNQTPLAKAPHEPIGTFLGYAITALLGKEERTYTSKEIREALLTCQKYSEEEFERTLQWLVSEGIAQQTESRYHLKSTDHAYMHITAHLSSPAEKTRFTDEVCDSIIQFHRLEQQPNLKKMFKLKIRPTSQFQMHEIAERWTEFNDRMDAIDSDSTNEELYQICFFAIPITNDVTPSNRDHPPLPEGELKDCDYDWS